MIALNPHTLYLAAQAARNILLTLPKGPLTKLGLGATAAPLIAPGVVGAAVAGAVVTACAIPQSRRYLLAKAKIGKDAVMSTLFSAQEDKKTRPKARVTANVNTTPYGAQPEA